ncbi:alpha-ketoglutarate-dependent dioxygenase AlkB [Variovorax sp. J22P271]|uniref:alpha-ketoglutarate-dependent dioxygenase AlkB n=1 Tax=Variovorax davisae TaxID=3053515 RepID=UPI002575615A|nr:alpha-ketoglutarate-dependent dioxygenase AlkB [Variovorax sp. J22P271]MDM0032262.1 alpha-ketoglutarate-dependent dioxygenase AlkB [Variovorax sp. J22P271]
MQTELFDSGSADAVPEGWVYQEEFLGRDEESSLIEFLQGLPLAPMQYKQFLARRRGISFGGHYDFDANRLRPSPSLPEELMPLRARAAAWLDVEAAAITHVLVAEYRPGTPLGWHRDVPEFEDIVGISLGEEGLLEFRRYPPRSLRSDPLGGRLRLRIAPRSIYRISGPARWNWQHAVLASPALRYSITMRTPRTPT